jgi:hypothetical protein
MAAITASKNILEKYDPKAYRDEKIGADSTQFFKGGLVGLVAGKVTKLAAATAAVASVWICEDEVLTGASNTVRVGIRNGIFPFVGAGFTVADIGKVVYVSDDQTVTLTGAPATEVVVGSIQEVESATLVWVQLIGPREAIPTAAVVTG